MSSTQQYAIEARVDAKKDQMIKHNPYAKKNPGLLMDKVFCLCTVCSVLPLLTRNTLSLKGTAHSHRQVDVKKGVITNDELLAAKGQKTFVSYGDFFGLFRKHARGELDEHGRPCEFQPQTEAIISEGEGGLIKPANLHQGPSHAACSVEHEGLHTHESHCVEGADAPCSGSNPLAQEQGHCNESSGEVTLDSPMDELPCSSRKPSQYTPLGLCGWWASFWSGIADAQPSEQELRGRQPGEDGSRPVRCTLKSATGEAYCSEDAGAAATVNRFLAEELARACQNNKSHNCFSSDLQAFKNSEHVSEAIKMGLEGLETYAQVMRRLEQAGGMMTYVYDICPNEQCSAVFRGEHRGYTECPKCEEKRFTPAGKAAKQLYYLPVSDWLRAAWADPDIARGMDWHGERMEIGATSGTMYRDHFDASIWQDTFCKDPIIAENGGPAKNVGLQFCADGVNPYKRKSYSMWFGALSILNLPPAIRHTVATMHLCFIVPGPKKPADFSPFLDILTDELDMLYWAGIEVREQSSVHFICRAMLLSIITDYRGLLELFRLTGSPAFVGGCYKCMLVGFRMAEGSGKTIYPGFWKWLPLNQEDFRAQASQLNGSEPADTLPPRYKTTADMRAAAEEGDSHMAEGSAGVQHPVKRTGVHASHAFWKLKYYKEEMYGPDPMHTLSNEVKACFSMLGGSVYCGTTKAAQVIKEYEADINERYILPTAAAKGTKKTKLVGNKQKYPFVLPLEAQRKVSQTLSEMTSLGHVPKFWSTANLNHCFEHPSFLKAHDWLLLAGPIGKYVLQGYLPPRLEAVLFEYFDCLAKLGAKEVSHSAATTLKREIVESLAKMELNFPAWELDINRHMVLHLAERIPIQGPLWATAMWSYERLWNRLCQWKSQNNHPEAVMVNTYKAFKTACKVKRSSDIKTFDRPTDEVLIPAYVHSHMTGGEVYADLSDGHSPMRLQQKVAKREHARAEFHMFHLRTNERYQELWIDYVTHEANRDHSTLLLKDMDQLLSGWLAWGLKSNLSTEDMSLCRGPHPRYLPYDRATINGQQFVVSRLQGGKYRNDIVMMETAGQGIEVGQVKSFIKLPVAGTAIAAKVERSSELQLVAWVNWFGRSTAGSTASSTGLTCAQKIHSDNRNGNVYSITDLKPFNIAVVPRRLQDGSMSTNDWTVLVSRPIVLL